MSRSIRLGLVLPFTLFLGGAPAQVEFRKESPVSNQVEVRFVDGSVVRMELLQETIDVVTKYGRLTVPTRDLRHVEFGLRLSEATRKRVDDAVAQLGDKAHAVREGASRELVLLGYEAYPALLSAVKSPDREVSRRAEQALKLIRDKVAPHLLRDNFNDRIETTEFPISGRISGTTLKARSMYFGEKDVKIADLFTIHSFAPGGRHELTVDAAKYGSAADQWMDSGIEVDGHAELAIVASGRVDLWQDGTGQYATGPNGYKANAGLVVMGNQMARGTGFPGGALVGRIGEGTEASVHQVRIEVADEDLPYAEGDRDEIADRLVDAAGRWAEACIADRHAEVSEL